MAEFDNMAEFDVQNSTQILLCSVDLSVAKRKQNLTQSLSCDFERSSNRSAPFPNPVGGSTTANKESKNKRSSALTTCALERHMTIQVAESEPF